MEPESATVAVEKGRARSVRRRVEAERASRRKDSDVGTPNRDKSAILQSAVPGEESHVVGVASPCSGFGRP